MAIVHSYVGHDQRVPSRIWQDFSALLTSGDVSSHSLRFEAQHHEVKVTSSPANGATTSSQRFVSAKMPLFDTGFI